MEELWKDIEGYPGYQVSNLGRVRSLNWRRTQRVKYLTPQDNGHGYFIVYLTNNKLTKKTYIHRIVAKSFPDICGSWFDGCEVDHINTIKDDNRPENLIVCTRKDNTNNPITRQHNSESHTGKKMTPEQVEKNRESHIGLLVGEKNPMYGKHHSEESRRKISESLKGKQHPNKGKHWKIENGKRVWY